MVVFKRIGSNKGYSIMEISHHLRNYFPECLFSRKIFGFGLSTLLFTPRDEFLVFMLLFLFLNSSFNTSR